MTVRLSELLLVLNQSKNNFLTLHAIFRLFESLRCVFALIAVQNNGQVLLFFSQDYF